MESTTINVPSISCNVCSDKITQGVRSLNGIVNVAVDLKTKDVDVEYDPESIQPQDIRKKISSLGYEVQ